MGANRGTKPTKRDLEFVEHAEPEIPPDLRDSHLPADDAEVCPPAGDSHVFVSANKSLAVDVREIVALIPEGRVVTVWLRCGPLPHQVVGDDAARLWSLFIGRN